MRRNKSETREGEGNPGKYRKSERAELLCNCRLPEPGLRVLINLS